MVKAEREAKLMTLLGRIEWDEASEENVEWCRDWPSISKVENAECTWFAWCFALLSDRRQINILDVLPTKALENAFRQANETHQLARHPEGNDAQYRHQPGAAQDPYLDQICPVMQRIKKRQLKRT
jgi:hypothetical protein